MAITKADLDVADEPPPQCPYGVDKEVLDEMNQQKDVKMLDKLGGLDAVAKLLVSNTTHGLNPRAYEDQSIGARQQWYGKNTVPAKPQKAFVGLMWDAWQDPVVLLLIAAALISTVLGAAIPDERARHGWVEGVSIWIVALLVTALAAGNDWNRDRQLRKLEAERDTIKVKVVRHGMQTLVSNHELVVGDLLLFDMGDRLMADAVLVDSDGLIVDEGQLTGNLQKVKKSKDGDRWLKSGTHVIQGNGSAIIIAVGDSTEWNKGMARVELADEGEPLTPLQDKLAYLAATIGKIGFIVAVVIFSILMIRWMVSNKGFPIKKINENGPIQFFLYCITLLVVAVPEGLPLVAIISLAYSLRRMIKDNNFVRHIASSETMGAATTICSNKTGTITEDGSDVVAAWCAGTSIDHAPSSSDIPGELLNELRMNIAMNSKAYLVESPNGDVECVGSRCECALLKLLTSWGFDYKQVRDDHAPDVVKHYVFNSARKMSSVLMRFSDRMRLYNKGAAEWVLARCKCVYTNEGNLVNMTDEIKQGLLQVVTDMSKQGMRCLCLSYTDYPLDDPHCPPGFFDDATNVDANLNCMCIVGIKDNVNPGVLESIRAFQHAGIVLRILTGDNVHTAEHVARECGIMTEPDHVALEGAALRAMEPYELQGVLPKLRVLARTSPEDKVHLIQLLQKWGDVVAVTGDGANDAPALRHADVGLAWGMGGSEVAKEAADILITNDSFKSILKTVMWGRALYTNVQKFLQFQLTVNVSALTISFIAAVSGTPAPLNVLQLLWINLIMDTMAALALATERPAKDLLDLKPHGYEASLITVRMWKHIISQAAIQVVLMCICLFVLPTKERYAISDKTVYYTTQCGPKLVAEYSYSINGTRGGADWMCDIMMNCGFPFGSEATMPACPLTVDWVPITVPDNAVDAVCLNRVPDSRGTSCADYSTFNDARYFMRQAYKKQVLDDWERPLTVLFTLFIFLQVFNEINCRRIRDEYNVFQGIFSNLIFPCMLFVTIGFQLIIVTFLGLFFKVTPLIWQEWLAIVGVASSSFFLSFLTRFLSRTINWSRVASCWGRRSAHGVHPEAHRSTASSTPLLDDKPMGVSKADDRRAGGLKNRLKNRFGFGTPWSGKQGFRSAPADVGALGQEPPRGVSGSSPAAAVALGIDLPQDGATLGEAPPREEATALGKDIPRDRASLGEPLPRKSADSNPGLNKLLEQIATSKGPVGEPFG